jgi:hypothetical protein
MMQGRLLYRSRSVLAISASSLRLGLSPRCQRYTVFGSIPPGMYSLCSGMFLPMLRVSLSTTRPLLNQQRRRAR